jgi:hypothetical protein
MKNLAEFKTEKEQIEYLKGMELHESCSFHYNSGAKINTPLYNTTNKCTILRVLNGWIYTIRERETFVPHSPALEFPKE